MRRFHFFRHLDNLIEGESLVTDPQVLNARKTRRRSPRNTRKTSEYPKLVNSYSADVNFNLAQSTDGDDQFVSSSQGKEEEVKETTR